MNDLSLKLAQLIKSNLRHKPYLVAIDGVDGVGKTYFAESLVKALHTLKVEAVNISIDAFHNSQTIRYRRGEFSAEGYYYDSFDYDKFLKQVIEPSKDLSNLILCPTAFDYQADRVKFQDVLEISARTVVVVDGVFLQRSELKTYWDFSVWLVGDDLIIMNRAIERDVKVITEKSVIEAKYTKRYQAGQALYRKLEEPNANADIIIENTDFENPIILKGTIPSTEE